MTSISQKQEFRRRSKHYHAPGIAGRATGFQAKENVRRDDHGLEDIDDFFNSDNEGHGLNDSSISKSDDDVKSITEADTNKSQNKVVRPTTSDKQIYSSEEGKTLASRSTSFPQTEDYEPESTSSTVKRTSSQLVSSTPLKTIKKKLSFDENEVPSPILKSHVSHDALRTHNTKENYEADDSNEASLNDDEPMFNLAGDVPTQHRSSHIDTSPSLPFSRHHSNRRSNFEHREFSNENSVYDTSYHIENQQEKRNEEDQRKPENTHQVVRRTPSRRFAPDRQTPLRKFSARKSFENAISVEDRSAEEDKIVSAHNTRTDRRGQKIDDREMKNKKVVNNSVRKSHHKGNKRVKSKLKAPKRVKGNEDANEEEQTEEDGEYDQQEPNGDVDRVYDSIADHCPSDEELEQVVKKPKEMNDKQRRYHSKHECKRDLFIQNGKQDEKQSSEDDDVYEDSSISDHNTDDDENNLTRVAEESINSATSRKGRLVKSKAASKKPHSQKITESRKPKPQKRSQPKRGTNTNVLRAAEVAFNPETGRPQRTRVKPLAFWKGEKVVYEPVVADDGRRTGLMQVKDVVMVDTPIEAKRRQRRQTTRKSKRAKENLTHHGEEKDGKESITQQTKAKKRRDTVIQESNADVLPSLQVDMQSLSSNNVTVKDWESENDHAQITAIKTYPMNDWKVAKFGMRFCKSFSLSDAGWSAGQIELAPGISKPRQSTQHNFLVFTITAGRLKVNIHKDEFEVGIGTCFYVPPDNFYSVSNAGTETARAFFVQVKEPPQTD